MDGLPDELVGDILGRLKEVSGGGCLLDETGLKRVMMEGFYELAEGGGGVGC